MAIAPTSARPLTAPGQRAVMNEELLANVLEHEASHHMHPPEPPPVAPVNLTPQQIAANNVIIALARQPVPQAVHGAHHGAALTAATSVPTGAAAGAGQSQPQAASPQASATTANPNDKKKHPQGADVPSTTPTPPLQMPGPALNVPRDIQAKLTAGAAAGRALGQTFFNQHSLAGVFMLPGYVLTHIGWAPNQNSAQEKHELRRLHQIAKTRTAAGNKVAQWLSDVGLGPLWDAYLKQYEKTVSPAQAKAAEQLLHDTLDFAEQCGTLAKSSSLRTRPFIVDPTLKVSITKPGNNPSYPSGHSYDSFAAATVLAHLMPQRAPEFYAMAEQVAMARLYGGVHFPSDVAAGAKLGTAVATYMIDRAEATDRRHTPQTAGANTASAPAA